MCKLTFTIALTLPQIRFSFVEGVPFHENDELPETNKLNPHANEIHLVEKLKVPYKWWILSWWHVYLTNYDVPCKGHLKLWSTFMTTWAFLVKSGILGMSMEARMSLLNVSREYSFCACEVLGKIALFRRNTVFAVGSIVLWHITPFGWCVCKA